MSSITLVIKPTAGGDRLSVEVQLENTVERLKEVIQEKHSVPASEQRLIYKGQVLKDEKTVTSYGLQNEHVLHMVRKPAAGSTPSGGAQRPQPSAIPDFAQMGLGGMQGSGGGSPQDMLASMMQTPAMQSMMSNPESMRSMLQSMPAVSQLMDRNPEFAQLINNPQLLQEAMATSANPALMREQMRNADRAMSNIESHPEGHNMLRRMYENIQAPLLDARSDSGAAAQPPTSTASAPASDQPQSSPNAAPLPNPWAGPGSTPSSNAPAAGLPAGLGGLGGMGGLGGGTGGGQDMAGMLATMQNPQMQAAMRGIMSQPGMMENIANMNPQLRQMMDANPQIRETLSNPAALEQALNPQNIQAMMQMQQAMQQLQGSGMFPGGGTGGGRSLNDLPMPGMGGMPNFSSMMDAVAPGAPGMGGYGGIPPVADPEQAFAQQLTQLEGMGFVDRQANIRALQGTGGDVNGAVERLLSGI